MIDNEKREEAIDLAIGYIMEQATYFRPNDLPDIRLEDYEIKVLGDDIFLIHRTEGYQLGNTESLQNWLELAEEEE